MENLKAGMTGQAETIVQQSNMAVAMGSGEVEVFATPAMVALMEAAAVACVKPALASADTTVGVSIQTSHIAATPPGMKVKAEATLEMVDGRRLRFKVVAFDEKEKIGEGVHERVVVGRDRFLEKVRAKGGS